MRPDLTIRIANRPIGSAHPLYVIAEIGLNHGGSRDAARALVDAAAKAGAAAVKVQSLRADRLVSADCPAPAHVRVSSLREFFRRFELDEEAHRAVAERARRSGLAFIATPFDLDLVDMLERVGCDAYKIASGDLTHLPLIARVAQTGKPIVISTGMGSLDEVSAAVATARRAGARELALLHCVSAYPVPPGSQNLRAIEELQRTFGVPVGLSDHGSDALDVVVAVALGAVVYEKHLVLEGDAEAADLAVSATSRQLAAAIDAAERARRALGHGRKVCVPAEAPNRAPSRRSLYAARDLGAGEVIDPGAVVALRPAAGLDPGWWPALVGQRARRPIARGTPFREEDVGGVCRSTC